MKNRTKHIFLSFITSLLLACGGGDSGSGGDSSELVGTWLAICDSDGIGYYQTTIVFTKDTYSSTINFYTDPDCTNLDVTENALSNSGSFTVGGLMTPTSGGSARHLNGTTLINNGVATNEPFYDIYRVEGTRLYPGLYTFTYDGTTPEKRPIDLDFNWYLNKIP